MKVYFVKQLRITEGDGEEQDARLVPMLTAEELVAELRAAFLCAEFGFDGDLRHAGYIATWIDLLRADKRGSKRRRRSAVRHARAPAQRALHLAA